MTSDRRRAERHPTDEPDGTPAYQASLREPGASVGTGTDDSADRAEQTGTTDRGGYDAGAVSGDSGAYRPD